MKMKLTKGLLAAGALLLAGQVSAATVQMSPSTQTVSVNDPLSITVGGVGFVDGTSGGGVSITWDSTQLSLVSTVQDVEDGLAAAGFNIVFNTDIIGGTLDTTFGTFFSDVASPDFTLFTLNFVAIPPPSVSNLAIGISANAGTWLDAAGADIAVDYAAASVTVNAVPVPAAAWLFGSGLIGLVGIARRKTQLA